MVSIKGLRREAQQQNHFPEPGVRQAGKGLWRELRACLGCGKSGLQERNGCLRQRLKAKLWTGANKVCGPVVMAHLCLAVCSPVWSLNS